MLLDIGPDQTRLLIDEGEAAPALHTLGIGVENIARTCFKHEPPEAEELENAIMVIEDALEGWRTLITTDSRLFTLDQGIREIAGLAGLSLQPETVLSREAIENTFGRLLAITRGRPASAEGLPENKMFAARLLILREFMHHMKFESITIKE